MVQTPASKSIPSHVARRTLPDRAGRLIERLAPVTKLGATDWKAADGAVALPPAAWRAQRAGPAGLVQRVVADRSQTTVYDTR